MKILFDHPSPFFLAHGGFQTQIEQTKAALGKIGVEVEYVRWWDEHQKGDIIHYFGRPSAGYVNFAHQKGMKVVLAELLTGLGSRSAKARMLQKKTIGLARRVLPSAFLSKLAWEAYQMVDACVALTSWEAHLMQEMFDAPPSKVHVVPNGVEDVFFMESARPRGEWLVCTATITERKRVLELARAAVEAKTPLWVIGRPYKEGDEYSKAFLAIARETPALVRYEGAIPDRAKLAVIYREARGFVLLSTMESLSLSALEAAACECPLLLSDLPWARGTFGDAARFCPVNVPDAQSAQALRRFYDEAPKLAPPPKPATWIEVARQFAAVYESLLK